MKKTEKIDFEVWRREEAIRFEKIGFHICTTIDFSEASPVSFNRGRLGIGMECLDRDLWDYHPAIPALKQLGIRFARIQSGWAKTEKIRGTYNFQWLDEIINTLKENNIEPWLSLSYGNPLYSSDESGKRADGLFNNPTHSPDALNGWCCYVRAVVKHFRDRINCFEIWNEPDVSIFFPADGGKGNWTRQYMDLVRSTTPIIKECAPNAEIAVVTGGGTGSNAYGGAKLLEQGIGELADIFAFHSYNYTPERFGHLSKSAYYDLFRRLAPQMKLWRGEAGVASHHIEGTKEALCDYEVSESIQQRWVGRHLILDLGDPMLEMTSYFHLYDFMHFDKNYHYYFGLLRNGDYSRKPAFYLVEFLKRFLDDGAATPDRSMYMECGDASRWTYNLPESLIFDVEVVPFRRNGEPVFAYWHKTTVREDMTPVQVWENSFLGDGETSWKKPVVVDPCTRNIYTLSLQDNEERLRIPLLNRPLLLMEEEALKPFILTTLSRKELTHSVVGKQSDHE